MLNTNLNFSAHLGCRKKGHFKTGLTSSGLETLSFSYIFIRFHYSYIILLLEMNENEKERKWMMYEIKVSLVPRASNSKLSIWLFLNIFIHYSYSFLHFCKFPSSKRNLWVYALIFKNGKEMGTDEQIAFYEQIQALKTGYSVTFLKLQPSSSSWPMKYGLPPVFTAWVRS